MTVVARSGVTHCPDKTCPGGLSGRGCCRVRDGDSHCLLPCMPTSSTPVCLHPTSDAAAAEAREQSSKPWSAAFQGTAVLSACVLPVLQSGAGSPWGTGGGKVEGLIFILWDCFPSLSPTLPPLLPPPSFCHIVLSLNQTFTKGIRGSVLINSKAGWKRGNQPWRSAEGHSCSGGPGRSKSPG